MKRILKNSTKTLKLCFNVFIIIACFTAFNSFIIPSQEEEPSTKKYVSVCTDTLPSIDTAYISNDEHSLILKLENGLTETAYCDSSSVLQLIEISPDNKWAIVISMPAEIDDGRVETTYQLIDLCNREMVNDELEAILNDFVPGNDMYFEINKLGALYLTYYSTKFDYSRILLSPNIKDEIP